MAFDKSFPANRPAPAVPVQPVAPSGTSFPQVNGPLPPVPFQPINPLNTSFTGVIPQGYFGPNATSISTNSASATNIALSNSSNKYQAVSMSSPDLAIVLPDATTVPVGVQVFVLENIGSYPVLVQSFGGALIGVLSAGMTHTVFLKSNTSSVGVWKLISGDISKDNGLNWFGNIGQTLGTVVAAGTDPQFWSFAITSRFGVVGWDDGINTKIQGYDLQDGVLNLGTAANLQTAHQGIGPAIDAVALSSSRLFIQYTQAATNTFFRIVDINTTTLALTLGTAAGTGVAPTSFIAACDMISSTLLFAVYCDGSAQTQCLTISISGSNCTLNSAVAVGPTNNTVAGCCVNSATLATVYSCVSFATTPKVTRVPLTGTTVAPGSDVAVTSRLPLSTAAISQVSSTTVNRPCTVIPLSSTTSYGVARDANMLLYGEVFTDTGSTVTLTETLLTIGEANTGAAPYAHSLYKSTGTTKGLLYNMYGAANSPTMESWNTLSVSGTAVSLSPTLPSPPMIALMPDFSTTAIAQFVRYNFRGYNGVGLMPFTRSATPKLFFQPVACA